MRVVYEYSHLGGAEILAMRHPDIEQEVYSVIASVHANRTKTSREKTMPGRMLFNPVDMNRQFLARFRALGFEELRDYYRLTIPDSDFALDGVYKQIDFVKRRVLVEVQFGKYAFMFYDMAKFQYFFNENQADMGIEIVPCHNLKKEMSTGVSYGEQLVYDIERLKRHFPAVPIKVILVDAD